MLRDYQQKAINDIYSAFRQHNRVLFQLPTGGGKGILIAQICRDGYSNGRRVLAIAHREELVKDLASRIEKSIGSAVVGIIKSGIEPDYSLPIQVASVQTLINRLDLAGRFNLVICDEAHHSIASSYTTIYNYHNSAKLLGVTATPIRLNGKGFGDIFDILITSVSTQQLIDLGYLSRFKLFAAPPMKFENVGKTAGDYSQFQIAYQNDPTELAGDIVDSYREHANNTQCLVFATSVEHSIAIAKAYNQQSIPAAHLDGTTPSQQREQILADFVAKRIRVVSNCALFGEGVDIPALETVQIARRTASVALHLQMLGRVLRVHPDKSHAIIIDHTDNWERLGLPTKPRTWSLTGVKDGKQAIERDEKGEVKERQTEPAISTIPIVNDDIHLREIAAPSNEQEAWEYELRLLIQTQQSRGYKPGWLIYRVSEMRPPLFIWRALAKHNGYHWKWADRKFAEQQNQQLELVS